jgi:hypothetical protein
MAVVVTLGERASSRGRGCVGEFAVAPGDKSDKALVCLEPENTRCVDFLTIGLSVLLSSEALKATAGTFSSWLSTTIWWRAGRDFNLPTCRSSFFFLPTSCWAQCFFRSDRSVSAFCNSSRSSNTRLSCAAKAVRKEPGSVGDVTTVGSRGAPRIESAG